MIENAYYSVAPPETSQIDKKERPPLHQYIRKLLYADLNKSVREAIDVFSVTNDLTVNTDPQIPNSFFTPSQTTTGDDYFLLN